MRFVKMHGAGNDYVYVDLFAEQVPDAPAVARAVSDRHTGVGSDGLILLGPSETADVSMTMYNADGSRAQMCGNGVRCLAVLARDLGRADGPVVRVATDAGVKAVELLDGGRARVDMGAPEVLGRDETFRVLDREFRVTRVSMGNPHAVVFVDGVAAFDVARYGAALETDPAFPERTNVEFVEVLSPRAVRQRTWERGSGETQACGTGACAVCVAGVATGRTEAPLRAHLRGGDLELEWDGGGAPVFMTGPTAYVFRGEWPVDGV